MMNLNFFTTQTSLRSRSGEIVSHVNSLVGIMSFNPSPAVSEYHVRRLLQDRMVAFVQLAAIRRMALKVQLWLADHPEISMGKNLIWETVGYDWIAPLRLDDFDFGSRPKPRSPAPANDKRLAISRVRRSMSQEKDALFQQRQRNQPHPRHLPDAESFPSTDLAPSVPTGNPKPRRPSRLKEVIQMQEDGDLEEMYDDFEGWRSTGERADHVQADGIPSRQRNPASASSNYRPYSLQSNSSRSQAGTGPIGASPTGLNLPTTNRLGSSELFPDRYRSECADVTSDSTSSKARDSVTDGTCIATRDFAYSQGTASMPPEEAETRRSAARSDSDMSSVSSTESSRARKALAVKLNQGKSRVELTSGKSTASVGFTSSAGTFLKNMAKAFSPSRSKTSAEDVTRELSKSPTRRRSNASHDDGLVSSLIEETQDTGSAGPLTQQSRQKSEISVLSANQLQQRTSKDGETPVSSHELGTLPSPSKSEAELPTPSSREGTIEGGEESHSNALQNTKHPIPNDSESHESHP